jgi:hypothetical protein
MTADRIEFHNRRLDDAEKFLQNWSASSVPAGETERTAMLGNMQSYLKVGTALVLKEVSARASDAERKLHARATEIEAKLTGLERRLFAAGFIVAAAPPA